MGLASPRFSRETANEVGIADFLPYKEHVSPTTISTGGGDLLRIWKVDGLSFATADHDVIHRRKEELANLYRGIGSPHVSVWVHQVRRRISDRLHGNYDNAFAKAFDEKYYAELDEEQEIAALDAAEKARAAGATSEEVEDAKARAAMDCAVMANELYLTLVYRPYPTRAERINRVGTKRTVPELMQDRRDSLAKLDDLSQELEAGLRQYGAEVLSTFTAANGALYSEPLAFLNLLITGEVQDVRVPRGPIDAYLGNAYTLTGNETMFIRSPTRDRYAQLIDLKDYPESTDSGMLNKLLLQKVEFITTQSFSFLNKRDGEKFLKVQRNQLRSSQDGSVTQLAMMDKAIDELNNGRFLLGEYHFSIMVFGDTLKRVGEGSANVLNILKEEGFLPVKISVATEAGFYAQLPANWKYRPRVARLTTQNFAGLAPFHSFPQGKRDGNPWGEAVILLRTPSHQPFYFNFHTSKEDEDSFDKKTLANTSIIGASGTGKTVLLSVMETALMKYRTPQRLIDQGEKSNYGAVFFDKDCGAELAVRMLGGRYWTLKDGVPTKFNPFQREPTPAHKLFLHSWVCDLLRQDGMPITAVDDALLTHAIDVVTRLPKKIRRLGAVLQSLPEGDSVAERENSLRRRLAKWVGDGPFAWVADNEEDRLDFSAGDIFGFDGTSFLDNKQVCGAISSYLLYCMEEMLDGRRMHYTMDEAWKWFSDDSPYFQKFAGNKQLTIRKQNGFGIFATQMPSSMLESKIGSALVQQCGTQIFLPNGKADRDEYVGGFKLTHTEYDMIKAMPDECRMFMVKQGHRSTFARLDLSGMDDELAILSGSTDNIEILHDVLADVGEDPKVWAPIFHRKRKERAKQTRIHIR